MRLGILTISDSVPTGKRIDASGPQIRELLGHYFEETLYRTCTDYPEQIILAARELLTDVDILITNGGTGMMPRDNTVPALLSLGGTRIRPLERAISAAMILACGPLAAIATPLVIVLEGKYILALPGKTDEVTAAVTDVIKPFVLHHLVFDKLEIKNIAKEYLRHEYLQDK